MFINEIIIYNNLLIAANSKIIVTNNDIILYYSTSENVIKNHTYKKDIKYDHKDENGRYRVIVKRKDRKASENDFKRKNTMYKKIYETENKTRPYTSVWEIAKMSNRKNNYPTEKSSRLLERIICLSTK